MGRQRGQSSTAQAHSFDERVAQLEISLLTQALKKSSGNKSAAARQLGLSERAMRYKMKKYGL